MWTELLVDVVMPLLVLLVGVGIGYAIGRAKCECWVGSEYNPYSTRTR